MEHKRGFALEKTKAEHTSDIITVDTNLTGIRLDAYLAQEMGELSRNRYKQLIKDGAVSIDGSKIIEPNYRVNAGQNICLIHPEPQEPVPLAQNIPLNIIFEDSDLIVIDKPAGMVVHPAAGHWTGTLVNALLYHCGTSLSGIGGVKRPGIVHRLDKETSGLLVVAKNDITHNGLAAQFADHGRNGPLRRSYQALIWGTPNKQRGTINAPLGRSSKNPQKQSVLKSGGRHAITHYHILETYRDVDKPIASLIECQLETGRTHQIRVHMTHINHPVIGDPDYGTGFKTKCETLPMPLSAWTRKFPRQALHATSLCFEHPVNGKTFEFQSDYPKDMHGLISGFRNFFH